MFKKVMEVPDRLIIRYFELATDILPDELDKIKEALKGGENPRDCKMLLALRVEHPEYLFLIGLGVLHNFPFGEGFAAIISQGAAQIIGEDDLKAKLARSVSTGTPLTVKLGLDPSAPDIHSTSALMAAES